MATLKLYLDARTSKADGTCSLKIAVNHQGSTAFINLNISISPNHWDKRACKVIVRNDKTRINLLLQERFSAAQSSLLELISEGSLKHSKASFIRDKILQRLNPEDNAVSVKERFCKFANNHENKRTQDIYKATWHLIELFDKNASRLIFEDVNKDWLDSFFLWLASRSPSVNARNIHLRNIRAVFNDALDNELITCYPFRRYKIRPVQTRKRCLSVNQLRELFNSDVEPWQERYVDAFKLMFFLEGINVGDLCSLTSESLNNGRIEYNRKKTKKLYSIKLEPEALEIIEKYKGKNHLLSFADECSTYIHFSNRMNFNLKRIMPGLTTYYARHSWATIAASLDIPKETISAALGHGGNSVTDIYISFDYSKVDKANRAVIDYVLKSPT